MSSNPPTELPATAAERLRTVSAALDVLACGFVCADIALAVPQVPLPDEKVRATSRQFWGGGPAANAAVQAARLGGRAGFCGRVGDDAFGAALRAEFVGEYVDVRGLATGEVPTAIAAVLVPPDGRRAIVSHRSPLPDDEPPQETPLAEARVLLLDGHEPGWSLLLARAARAAGVAVVLDAGTWNETNRALAALSDHVVAAEPYARSALGCDPLGASADALESLAPLGGKPVVVTLGARGLVWSREGRRGVLPAPPVEVVDTTGAGDAFHGAYALAVAKEQPWIETLRYASAAGALACSRFGARPALADAAAVAQLLAKWGN